MEYFNAKWNHFCYLRIKDSTVLLTSSPRLLSLVPDALPLSYRRLISGTPSPTTPSTTPSDKRGGGGLKKCFSTLWASVWSKNNNSAPSLDLPLLIIAKTTNYFWLYLFAIAWFCISSHISTSYRADSMAAQDWTKHTSNICYKLSWYADW